MRISASWFGSVEIRRIQGCGANDPTNDQPPPIEAGSASHRVILSWFSPSPTHHPHMFGDGRAAVAEGRDRRNARAVRDERNEDPKPFA